MLCGVELAGHHTAEKSHTADVVLSSEMRLFSRLHYLPTADLVDKQLRRSWLALLAIVQASVAKILRMIYKFLQRRFRRISKYGFARSCFVTHYCNSVYVAQCLSLLVVLVQYTSDVNSNCHHGYQRYCHHRFFKLR